MFKKKEKQLLVQIEQIEKEIRALKDSYIDLQLKRNGRDDKESERAKRGEEYDDPSNMRRHVLAYCQEIPISSGDLIGNDEPMRELEGDLSGLLYEPEEDSTMVEITENMYAKKKHVCPNVSETTILQVADSAYFDIHRSMVADEGAKSIRSVRIPLRFCPFCGEKIVYDQREHKEIPMTK